MLALESATGRAGSTSHGSRRCDGRVGFAPFIVAPRQIGEQRVAVVLPTLTWQAYNFRDDDGDGSADSWYAAKRVNSVRLGRAVPRSRRAVRVSGITISVF